MDNNYESLIQKPIIDLMIEGEIFPYLTGNDIKSMGRKFNVNTNFKSFTSRYEMLTSIMYELIGYNKITDFLSYYFNYQNISKEVRDIIDNNRVGKIKYSEIKSITEVSQDSMLTVRNKLIEELMKKINDELLFSEKKLINHSNQVLLIDIN